MANQNPFAAALARHDMSALRAAFEACRQSSDESYDRTNLHRWLHSGTIPTKADFIQRLADELDDPRIYEAFQEVRGSPSAARVKTVVSRFEGLTPVEKDEAFHEIRRDYVSHGRPVREKLAYRIEVHDPPQPNADHLVIRLDISWEGRLPAQAQVAFVTNYEGLGDAYDQADCIFRELLDFEPDEMVDLLDGLADDQVLAYNPLGAANPLPVTHRAQLGSNGIAQFDNDEVDRAHIKLSLSYPVPKGTPMFPVKIGEYAVPGPAEATLTLISRSTSRPRAFAFLAPGRQREWAVNQLRANELFISLGTAATVLGEGDGVVLSWTVG